MMDLHRVSRHWIVAAWLAWPAALIVAAALALHIWLGSREAVLIGYDVDVAAAGGWRELALAAGTGLIVLAAFFGPPLALTLGWRSRRARGARNRSA